MIGIDAIGAAETGINAALTQVNASAVQSVALMDEPAFQGERPLLAENPSGGVDVAAIIPSGTEGTSPSPSRTTQLPMPGGTSGCPTWTSLARWSTSSPPSTPSPPT